MVDVNLSLVHELDQHFDVWELDVPHYDNGVLLLVLGQNRVEVRAARWQNHLRKNKSEKGGR